MEYNKEKSPSGFTLEGQKEPAHNLQQRRNQNDIPKSLPFESWRRYVDTACQQKRHTDDVLYHRLPRWRHNRHRRRYSDRNPERTDLIETRVIDGKQCLVITVNDHIEVNGVNVRTMAPPSDEL